MQLTKDAHTKAGSRQISFKTRERYLSMLLLLPAVLVVGIVYIYPAVSSIIYSFSEFDMLDFAFGKFVGLRNYIELLSEKSTWVLIKRTIFFGTSKVLIATVIAFLIAMLLNKKFVGCKFLRVLILLPWAIPPVVSGTMWGQMFHAESGIINAIIYQLGLGDGNTIWLGTPKLALGVIIVAEVWRALPFLTLFILAGLQNISPDMHEAASIDGANAWQRFTRITMPLIIPVMIPLMVLQFAMAMKTFDVIFVLTRGGQNTSILNYMVYKEGFEYFCMERAAAGAYILVALTLLVIGAMLYLQKLFLRRTGQ